MTKKVLLPKKGEGGTDATITAVQYDKGDTDPHYDALGDDDTYNGESEHTTPE